MNGKRYFWILIVTVLAVASTSCVTSKKVRYLQDLPKDGLPINDAFEVTVSPYDELTIRVLTNGTEEELLMPFNMESYYLVDGYGNIQFPVLGDIHVQGLTRLQLQDTICSRLIKGGHLSKPMVVARFNNFRIFMLTTEGGKVISINNEHCTFLEALALSGGLSLQTRRDRIGVMREVDGKMLIHYLDPRSTAIFDDDFFLMQPNDMIFTEETSFRFFRENLSNVSVILSSITIFASFVMIYETIKSLNFGNGK